MSDDIKTIILDTISDHVGDLVYYDRKTDEDLSRNDIDQAILTGVITVDEMVEKFRDELMKWAEGLRK